MPGQGGDRPKWLTDVNARLAELAPPKRMWLCLCRAVNTELKCWNCGAWRDHSEDTHNITMLRMYLRTRTGRVTMRLLATILGGVVGGFAAAKILVWWWT